MFALLELAAAFVPTARYLRVQPPQLRGGLWHTACSVPDGPDAALDELIRREVEAAFKGIEIEITNLFFSHLSRENNRFKEHPTS